MRAAVFEAVGKPIQIYDDVDIIAPRTGEVRVKVVYCSVCHSDLSVVARNQDSAGTMTGISHHD